MRLRRPPVVVTSGVRSDRNLFRLHFMCGPSTEGSDVHLRPLPTTHPTVYRLTPECPCIHRPPLEFTNDGGGCRGETVVSETKDTRGVTTPAVPTVKRHWGARDNERERAFREGPGLVSSE